MTDIIIMVLTGIGASLILIAAIGFVRMPDFFLRLSVATKAATLGIGLILAGAAIYFAEVSVVTRVVAITFFLFLTAPVAAHMISRSAYFSGTQLWHKSVIDELKGKYRTDTHELLSNSSEQNDVSNDEA